MADQVQLIDAGPSHVSVREGAGMVAGYYCIDIMAGEECWESADALERLYCSGLCGLVVSKRDALARARQLATRFGVEIKQGR
jgi:hypothetical protein